MESHDTGWAWAPNLPKLGACRFNCAPLWCPGKPDPPEHEPLSLQCLPGPHLGQALLHAHSWVHLCRRWQARWHHRPPLDSGWVHGLIGHAGDSCLPLLSTSPAMCADPAGRTTFLCHWSQWPMTDAWPMFETHCDPCWEPLLSSTSPDLLVTAKRSEVTASLSWRFSKPFTFQKQLKFWD